MELQLIRSATLRLTWNGRTLLVDPYLAARGQGLSYAGEHTSPLVELPMTPEQVLQGVDAVYVSHLHTDHFDAVARERLPRAMPVLCPAEIASRLRDDMGFEQVIALEGETRWNDAQLSVTSGRHGPQEVLADMGAVHGLVIAPRSGPTLYLAGDTIWCDEVRSAIQAHQPRYIVVHACGALWRGKGPLVMDEQHVQRLMEHAHDAQVIAVHLDSVDHATVSRAQLQRHFANLPPLASRLAVPDDGQCLQLA